MIDSLAKSSYVTAKQVAQLAGVSESSVRNYISRRHLVSWSTQQRIEEAVHQLGYSPRPGRPGALPTVIRPLFELLVEGYIHVTEVGSSICADLPASPAERETFVAAQARVEALLDALVITCPFDCVDLEDGYNFPTQEARWRVMWAYRGKLEAERRTEARNVPEGKKVSK